MNTIVIDTNVIVSALLSPQGVPAKILSFIFDEKVSMLYDKRILAEYTEVLHRQKFAFRSDLIVHVIRFIERKGVCINALVQEGVFNDEDDKIFYEVFKTGQADFLITGNKKHFPSENNIVTPKEFIDNYYLTVMS